MPGVAGLDPGINGAGIRSARRAGYFSVAHLGGPTASTRITAHSLAWVALVHWVASVRPAKDLTLPPDRAAEGYHAMDERRAVKDPAAP
jgi:hypothetical protein